MIFNSYKIGYEEVLFELDSIQLLPGKVYALIGPNGSGKSTFIRTLLGQQDEIAGDVFVKNRKLSMYTNEERAATISFVSSQFQGVDHMSVKEYLQLGRTPFTGMFGRMKHEDREKIAEMIHRFRLEGLISKMTKQISDGERQLCSIARAFIQDTEIILMDEPTAFLDYGNKMKVLRQLNDMAQSLGKTILYSTHDIDLVLEFQLDILKIVSNSKRVELVEKGSNKAELIEIFI